MDIHSFLGLFPRFHVSALEDVKRVEFQICFRALNLNEEQRSITCKQKVPPPQTTFAQSEEFPKHLTLGFDFRGSNYDQLMKLCLSPGMLT